MPEKTFTVVGTAINSDGTIKVRWANDIASRVKILSNNGCSDIKLIELPKPMTKLEATQFYLKNASELTEAQKEILEIKVAEKNRGEKRREVKATIINKVNSPSTDDTPTDPKVEAFIEKVTSES